MTLIDQIRRIERLDLLIRTRSTGTPAELARKLGMSQSQTYHFLKLLKENLNAPVMYSKAEGSYYYREDVRFIFGFRSGN
jgi:DNA-binding IclR family transcriptional regulator